MSFQSLKMIKEYPNAQKLDIKSILNNLSFLLMKKYNWKRKKKEIIHKGIYPSKMKFLQNNYKNFNNSD